MFCAARSHIGLVRQINQDGMAVHMDFQPYQLVVVADGMGGAAAGEVASRIAVDRISEAVRAAVAGNARPERVLSDAIYEANREIWVASRQTEEFEGMGTTVVAALFTRDNIIFAHVGDSRGYICRQGKLEQVTQDHSLVAELVRRGQLTEEEAQRHPQRNIVTRSLGTVETNYPELTSMAWTTGDLILLCTDGLSNLLSTVEIESQLSTVSDAPSQDSLERAADVLLRTALERGGPDNITLVLVGNQQEGDM